MQFSKTTFKEMKRADISPRAMCADVALRKRVVDSAFAMVVQKQLRSAEDLQHSYERHLRLLREKEENGRGALKKHASLKRAGSVIVLLSTGQCGQVVQDETRGDRRIRVQLDDDEESGNVIKVANSNLYWMQRCRDEADALRQIYENALHVPSVCDVQLGARVCLVHLNYQSGVVEETPKRNTRQTSFLVRMDVNRSLVRCVAEGMRLYAKDLPDIGAPFGKVGRPSLEESRIRRRRAERPPFLIPKSKQDKAWLESLKPPKLLSSILGEQSIDRNVSEEEEKGDSDDEMVEEEVEVDNNSSLEFIL